MDLVKRKRLRAVLESYGADPARWPEIDRLQLAEWAPVLAEEFSAARDIDQVMALASIPPEPHGFEMRLMARIAAGQTPSNVVALVQPLATPKRRGPGWLAALPLAASLLLGLYLGAAGKIDTYLPVLGNDTVATVDDDSGTPDDITGVNDGAGGQLS